MQIDVDVVVRLPHVQPTELAGEEIVDDVVDRAVARIAAQKTLDRPRAGSMIAAGASETPLAGLPLHGGQHGRLGSEGGAALW